MEEPPLPVQCLDNRGDGIQLTHTRNQGGARRKPQIRSHRPGARSGKLAGSSSVPFCQHTPTSDGRRARTERAYTVGSNRTLNYVDGMGWDRMAIGLPRQLDEPPTAGKILAGTPAESASLLKRPSSQVAAVMSSTIDQKRERASGREDESGMCEGEWLDDMRKTACYPTARTFANGDRRPGWRLVIPSSVNFPHLGRGDYGSSQRRS
ncbi:hypothetical protein LZ32DRAFT_613539 [Colletotrichum eremochloae]|nr:hypothetical protein LZ32DRAFT_613539 [Colletotrichum eremochloae]